ncbi:sulfatase-like hydrolase/transferase [Luteolibacter sp. LG18]|uniref:sulfatase-like hydrolase/transferase n=1 Tax=Luteolibacter sp. LG18 TaxID=2819286 RepID=UPI002B2C14EF|nr:choline-sulfatase [Luteolibacter sp. LG18]
MLKRVSLCLLFLASALHAERPNIILIESDDQRPDAIGALGNPTVKTPGLDRLVANGMAFTNARNQGSYNAAVCVASRSMLQSGQSLWHYDDNLQGRVTLGELLQKAGYHTYGTGKWHNGNESLKRSFTAADNITPGFLPKGHDSAFPTLAIHDGKVSKGANVPPRLSSDLIGSTAFDFLTRYEDKKPFFLYVGFNAPHDPYTADKEYEARYRDASGKSTVPSPPAFRPVHAFDPGVLKIRDEVLLPRPLDPAALADQNATYDGMISHLDHWVGKLLDHLKARGLDQNTVVIFTSDHGLARGSHGLLGKQNVYEHTLKIPFVISGPGVAAGKRTDSAVYNYELYRTIADYAGAMAPAQAEGGSLRPILEGKATQGRDATYHGYTSLMRAVVVDGWKLIEYHVKGERHTQLFHLTEDRTEEKDLSADPAQVDRLKTLRERMIVERDRYGDEDGEFWTDIGFGTPLAKTSNPHAKPKPENHTQEEEK